MRPAGLLVGLLYDSTALDAAWDLVKDWTAEERTALRLGAARMGLKTPFRSGTLQDVAREVLAISRKGLNARKRLNGHGENESLFLDDLDEIVKTGRTRAEDLIARFNGDWGVDRTGVYRSRLLANLPTSPHRGQLIVTAASRA